MPSDFAVSFTHFSKSPTSSCTGLGRPPRQETRAVDRTGCRAGQLNAVYSARYQVDIGPHVFPTRKYALIHARLIQSGVAVQSFAEEPLSLEEVFMMITKGIVS